MKRRLGTIAITAAACAMYFGLAASCFAVEVLEFPPDVACPGFGLRAEFSPEAGHLMNREFVDKNGNVVRFLQAGQNFPLTFTNVSTGSSYSVKAEGTVFSATLNPDNSQTWTLTGHTVISWTAFPGSPPDPFSPATIRYVGRLVVKIDSSGAVLSVSDFKGKQTDICAALS
jgi:hypothetical protein